MNKFKLTLFLLLLLAASCKQNNTSEPPVFKGYLHNPILDHGKPGDWDDLFAVAPRVILHDNMFYLFYMGGSRSGRMAVGLATSRDGYNFTKYEGNPLLAPDSTGFDVFTLGPGIFMKTDTAWLMYFNYQELAIFSPGQKIGRAMATNLTGPWTLCDTLVMESGKKGEWDDGFILPCSVLKTDGGTYRMYYVGGREITGLNEIYIGMATSEDGVHWVKYNDPATSQHPFAASDPVLDLGKAGDWDESSHWMAEVARTSRGYRIYFSGVNKRTYAIGYAESMDGIHWEKYEKNPVYQVYGDPYSIRIPLNTIVETPSVLILDTISFLYYDHGYPPGTISVATGAGKQPDNN